jgi:hypothetical protein
MEARVKFGIIYIAYQVSAIHRVAKHLCGFTTYFPSDLALDAGEISPKAHQ